jgi:hypothetical protein
MKQQETSSGITTIAPEVIRKFLAPTRIEKDLKTLPGVNSNNVEHNMPYGGMR